MQRTACLLRQLHKDYPLVNGIDPSCAEAPDDIVNGHYMYPRFLEPAHNVPTILNLARVLCIKSLVLSHPVAFEGGEQPIIQGLQKVCIVWGGKQK